MSFESEATVPSGEAWPFAQKKCFGLVGAPAAKALPTSAAAASIAAAVESKARVFTGVPFRIRLREGSAWSVFGARDRSGRKNLHRGAPVLQIGGRGADDSLRWTRGVHWFGR